MGFFGYLNSIRSTLFVSNRSLVIYILIAVLCGLFLYLGYYLYKKFVIPKLYPDYIANNELAARTPSNHSMANGSNSDNGTTSTNKPTDTLKIHFFYANWCPHCVKAKPIFDEFKAKYDGKVLGIFKIVIVEHDCTDEKVVDSNIIASLGVEGYPTIIAENTENKYSFDAKVKSENLETWIKTITK